MRHNTIQKFVKPTMSVRWHNRWCRQSLVANGKSSENL